MNWFIYFNVTLYSSDRSEGPANHIILSCFGIDQCKCQQPHAKSVASTQEETRRVSKQADASVRACKCRNETVEYEGWEKSGSGSGSTSSSRIVSVNKLAARNAAVSCRYGCKLNRTWKVNSHRHNSSTNIFTVVNCNAGT